jgi:hypothetical protein
MAVCALCFRTLEGRRWSTCSSHVLHELMCSADPLYADIVRNQLLLRGPQKEEDTPLCEYCFGFIKERKPHGMQLTVNHILSGGCCTGPSRPYLLRCLALLEQPQNMHPYLLGLQDLRDRVEARARLRGVDYAVVRWLFDGQPRVLDDGRLAKRLRQTLCANAKGEGAFAFDQHYYAAHRAMQTLLEGLQAPACRFCVANQQQQQQVPTTSYQGALVFGAHDPATLLRTMNEALLAFEEEEPQRFFFCVRCQRFSVVSYEYHCALRAHLGLTSAALPTADAYYAHLLLQLQQQKKKKTCASGLGGGQAEEEEDA